MPLSFGIFFVLAHKLIHTSSGVNKFQLAGEERVRSIRDFKFYDRIFVTVGIDYGFFGRGTTFGQNHIVVRHIFKNDQAIALWVDSFFHLCLVFCRFKRWLLNDCLRLCCFLKVQNYYFFSIPQNFFLLSIKKMTKTHHNTIDIW